MAHLIILGLGYTTSRLAARLVAQGWAVTAIRRTADADVIAFDDAPRIGAAIASATHILSSVPPEGEADPVLVHYRAAIAASPARWIGYLSSTGVYGDSGGGWVDESAPIGGGRRGARAAADRDWQGLRDDVRVFRLPGIYGPGRSPLDRAAAGAPIVAVPGQVFSRIHVDDIGAAVIASFDAPPGVYNIADDRPAAQAAVMAAAYQLIGRVPPTPVPLEEAGLSAAARAFYAENRRVANGKAKRLLDWRPAYPDYQAGLRALSATTSPITASTAPASEVGVQR